MNFLFLYLGLAFFQVPENSAFYDIKFESIDGLLMRTSDFAGKKIVIAVVSANAENGNLVRYLGSVQNENPSIQVIAIPTGDFNGSIGNNALKDMVKDLNVIIANPLKVKKANASLQHPLFAWLTQAKENSHFDLDVAGEGQVFVISEKGTLYSVLPKDVPRDLLSKTISQPFNE